MSTVLGEGGEVGELASRVGTEFYLWKVNVMKQSTVRER